MLNATRIIINQKTPKSRKEHKCFVCHRMIPQGSTYTFEKIIDLDAKWIFERKRHSACLDPEDLKKLYELDEKIDLKKILADWKQGEYYPRRAKKKIEVEENVPVQDLFGIEHNSIQTDHIEIVTTMVIASTKEEALSKYNTLAEERVDPPFCWNIVGIDHVKTITACK